MASWSIPIILMIICRVISVGLFFITPFFASLANLLFDTVDGNLLFSYNLPREIYQGYDKILDLIGYVVMFLVGMSLPIKKYVSAAFAYRSIGQGLFLLTQNHTFFFIFPNLLEYPFMLFLTFRQIGKERSFLKYQIPIYVFLGLNKMWMEYSIHIKDFNWFGFAKGFIGLP